MLTGSSGFLGTQITKFFQASSNKIIGIDFAESNNTEGLSEFINLDLSDLSLIESRLQNGLKNYDSIDVVINNAAIKPTGFYEKSTSYRVSAWDEVMRVNVGAAFFVSKSIFNWLRKSENPSIINISSIYGMVAPNYSIYKDSNKQDFSFNTPVSYSVSKTALLGLTRHLANEWGEFGIRVNSISPGGVENDQPDIFMKNYKKNTPLNRMALPSDITSAIEFLISEKSSYITGINLTIDGGWTL